MTALRAVSWSWSAALLGLLLAIPAMAVMPVDVPKGLALAFGVLPAAIVGVTPARRARPRIIVMGAFMGVPIWIGSVLAGDEVVAVITLWLFCIAAALAAARWPIGLVVLNMSVAMVGIGFSFGSGTGAALMGLIIGGSVYAYLVSLLWPGRPAVSSPTPPAIPRSVMLRYGIRLGAAGASAAAIGFWLDFDHVGWACAAALLVMRPSAEMQRLRSIGRLVSVVVGAAAAVGFAALTSAPGWYAVLAALAIVGAAATHGSRWYVTPAFTTLIAISLLVYAHPATAGSRFGERVGETILGVALAYFFGLAVPRLVREPADA